MAPPIAPPAAEETGRAQAALDKIRETSLPPGTSLVCDLTVICPGKDEVDAIAAQWDVPAGWTHDLSQYRTLDGSYPAGLMAVYVPAAARQVAA